MASNLWSKSPAAVAKAWNDVLADPQLTQQGSKNAGQLMGNWFKLKSSSPAIDRANVISTLLDDYFGDPRDSTPDIGGHEF